jgi:hypothetical protein
MSLTMKISLGCVEIRTISDYVYIYIFMYIYSLNMTGRHCPVATWGFRHPNKGDLTNQNKRKLQTEIEI